MSILQIIAHVKEHRIPGTFNCISKQTNKQTKPQYYVYMTMLVAVVMKIILQLVQINAFKLEHNKTRIFF